MLDRRQRGEVDLVPPTFVTLSDLAGFGDVDAVLAAAAARRPVPHYETRWATTEAGVVALWEGDAGYATCEASASGPRHRLLMGADRWELERD